jgi:Zn-dependent protease
MRYTIKFGSCFGIPVRIHFTFPLILIAVALEAGVRGTWRDALWMVALVLAVFVCVVLHELGHSLQVRRYGIEVRDIILLPIGGMARAERIPENPWQEIVVAISGPLVNYALAALLLVAVLVRGAVFDFENDFVVSLLSINVVLGTFNLIPAFPMDGGRILRGLLATRMDYLKATHYAKNVGQIIATLFAVTAFLNTKLIMLALIAVFIFFGAIGEERMVRVKVFLGGRTVKDFLPRDASLLIAEDSLASVSPRLATRRRHILPVTDRSGSLAAAVDARVIEEALASGRAEEPVYHFIETGFPLIEENMPAVQAYFLLRKGEHPLVGIVRNGDYVGLVHFQDIAGAIA